MFPTDEFYNELKGFVEARLHNDKRDGDDLTKESREIRDLQAGKYDTWALPYFVIEDPTDGKRIATHALELIDQEAKMLDFLTKGLKDWRAYAAKKNRKVSTAEPASSKTGNGKVVDGKKRQQQDPK